MKPTQAKQAITACIKANRPAFLWGAPGTGKSAIIKGIADEMFGNPEQIDKNGRYHDENGRLASRPYFIDLRATLLDPVDLRGVPKVNGSDKATWCIPDFLPESGTGILFLDEINTAPLLVQAALYQLILDRKIGDYRLPDGWIVIAAGNRATDGAITNRMSSALSNRFVHLTLDIDVADWSQWATENDINFKIIGFCRFRPELLHNFDPRSTEAAFASCRTWEYLSDIMDTDYPKDIEFELFSGIIGEATAGEFCGFLEIFNKMVNPDTIILDPKNATIPDDTSALHALCCALSRKATENNFGQIATYAGRLPAEFNALLIRDCIKICPEAQNTKAYIKWATENNEILI